MTAASEILKQLDREHAEPATLPAQALAQSRVDLVELIREGVPEPAFVPGGEPWLLAGKRYLIPAPAGMGKSLVGLVIAVEVVQHGGRVIVLDVENGGEEYARRLQDILRARDHDGTLTGACKARLLYHSSPRLDLNWISDAWVEAVAGADLVIVDSSRFVLSQVGLAEDKADGYSRFMGELIMPLSRAGIATVIFDNTGRDQDRERGSSTKRDLNEVVLALRAGAPFDRERAGFVKLVRTRERFTGLPKELHVHLGGDTYTAPVVASDTDADTESAFRPTGLMERVSRALEAEPGLSKRAVRMKVRGGNAWVDLALGVLIEEGNVEPRRDGQATLHYSVKPYREQHDLANRATVPEPCRGHA